jgi:S1-C subfamily serine protease
LTLPIRLAALLTIGMMSLGATTPAPPVAAPAPEAQAAPTSDDVTATERSVVRVVTVATVLGQVVGFGHGSGFAVAPNRIVTNAHVVGDAQEFPDNVVIGIVPSEGSRSYAGRLIRIDRQRDLALVEIVDGRVPAASVFTGPVPQREQVFALGYPGNVDVATARSMDEFIRPRTPLASDGIVSARDQIGGVEALVHDADIARGNSGGPLVDACGRVIGVNAFISRADEGDSPFSFAVSVRELAQFLQDAGQRFTGVASECLTPAEAAARDGALDAEARRAAAIAADRDTARREARAQELDRLKADAQERRETFIAFAIVLFGGAILAGAASFMYAGQAKPREQRAAMLAGGLLALAALIVFLLRPSPADVRLPPIEREGVAPQVAAAALTGNLVCTVDRNRGRITVSAGDDTVFAIDGEGCVNGRTQYARGKEGRWSRTFVPDEDATISRISYDPARGDYVIRRYLMSLDAMQAARRQHGAVAFQGCTADPERLAALSARENGIAALLPARPNEEIVSRCRAAATPAR